jgi:hypothetical protein
MLPIQCPAQAMLSPAFICHHPVNVHGHFLQEAFIIHSISPPLVLSGCFYHSRAGTFPGRICLICSTGFHQLSQHVQWILVLGEDLEVSYASDLCLVSAFKRISTLHLLLFLTGVHCVWNFHLLRPTSEKEPSSYPMANHQV